MEEAQIDIVDVEASPLSKSMQSKLQLQIKKMQHNMSQSNTSEPNNFTIFRTPHNISRRKKNLFEPSVISIGPFHRGKKHLRALEEQKWRFLQDFLSRCNHITLDLCIKEMMVLEKTTRGCYNESFVNLESNAFAEMMLLDGCFVLEYFRKLIYDSSNPIFRVAWNFDFIVLDLLLLENQIPFFIVDKLYEIGLKQEDRNNFVKKIVCYFDSVLISEPAEIPDPTDPTDSTDSTDSDLAAIPDPLAEIPDPPAEIHHLVHLFYHYLVPNPEEPVVSNSKSFDLTRMLCANSTGDISSMVIPCATELKHKGMKFRQKSKPRNMLDISFENGVLEIPKLKITDATKPIFANLIAFEHSNYGKVHLPFTSFVYFLDNLVNTPNDVTILQECEIVENWLGSEEELAHFINQVTEGNVAHKDHYLEELYKEVNKYSKNSWNRHRAKLIRDYFSNPWATISLIAAFILLGLTFVQSFYAVYAYKFPPSS